MQSRDVGVGLALPGVPHDECGTKGAASRAPTAKGLVDIGAQNIEACTHLSPKGANYLSPGQRPISAKIRKALQPGFSPTIALCQGGRDLIPIGHDGLQRYSGRDRCRHPMKGKLEFTPSTADERFLPAGGSPRGKSRSPRGPVSGSIRPPATFHTTKPDCCGRPAWARDPIGQSISDA